MDKRLPGQHCREPMTAPLVLMTATALKRVPRLFCKNERAVLPTTLHGSSEAVTLVAVGAILVASIMGIAFYATISGIERYAMRWHPSVRGKAS